jgi:hypothetical protein
LVAGSNPESYKSVSPTQRRVETSTSSDLSSEGVLLFWQAIFPDEAVHGKYQLPWAIFISGEKSIPVFVKEYL